MQNYKSESTQQEHWRKTSSSEPFPLGRRTDKRKLEFGCSSLNKKGPSAIHLQQGLFQRPIDDLQAETSGNGTSNSPDLSPLLSLETEAIGNGLSKSPDLPFLSILQTGAIGISDSPDLPDLLSLQTDRNGNGISNSPHLPPHSCQRLQVCDDRRRVMHILLKFRQYCEKLLDWKCCNAGSEKEKKLRRIDFVAAEMVKSEFGRDDIEKHYIGAVPGVQIGDEFYYRMELHILGLHRPPQAGIATVDYEGEKIAVSVVASGGYSDHWEDSNTLIYCGQRGRNAASWNQEEKKLGGGNLALFNSKRTRTPVRVIKGRKGEDSDTIYAYDGLYTVVDASLVQDPFHHRRVFKFKLVKISC